MNFESLAEILFYVADQPGFKDEIIGDFLRVIAEGNFFDLGMEVNDPSIVPLQAMSLLHKGLNTVFNNYAKRIQELQEELSEKFSGEASNDLLKNNIEMAVKMARLSVIDMWRGEILDEVFYRNKDKIKEGDIIAPVKPFQIVLVPQDTELYKDVTKKYPNTTPDRFGDEEQFNSLLTPGPEGCQ